MTGFELLNNFIENTKTLLRRVRPRVIPPQVTLPAAEPVSLAPFASNSMAEPVGPIVGTGNGNFGIKTGLITMVQANPFCGNANEDTNAHLQHLLELCSTITIQGVTPEAI